MNWIPYVCGGLVLLEVFGLAFAVAMCKVSAVADAVIERELARRRK